VSLTLLQQIVVRLGANVLTFIVVSMVAFLLVFVIWLGWFPTQSSMAFSFGGSGARAVTFILPGATIALLLMPHIARVATSEAFDASYVDAARLRELSERQLKLDHAFLNAAVPLVSVICVDFIILLLNPRLRVAIRGLGRRRHLRQSRSGAGPHDGGPHHRDARRPNRRTAGQRRTLWQSSVGLYARTRRGDSPAPRMMKSRTIQLAGR
jgi:hypothetical protein